MIFGTFSLFVSEIVIKDEAKSQNYVIFVSYFDAVDANYHLRVSD